MSLLLSVSEDSALLRIRHLVLQSAGHSVRSTLDLQEALSLARTEAFAGVVVGHSINAAARLKFLQELRSFRPQLPIIVLCKVGEPADFDGLATELIEPFAGPKALLAAVDRACRANHAGAS